VSAAEAEAAARGAAEAEAAKLAVEAEVAAKAAAEAEVAKRVAEAEAEKPAAKAGAKVAAEDDMAERAAEADAAAKFRAAAEAANRTTEADVTTLAATDVKAVAETGAERLAAGPRPYVWTASRDGDRVVLAGHVPSEATRVTLREVAASAMPAGAVIDDRMLVAPGAGDGFPDAASYGVRQLGGLSPGTAALVDGTLSIGGRALDGAAAVALRAALGVLPAGLALGRVEILDPVPPSFAAMTGQAAEIDSLADNGTGAGDLEVGGDLAGTSFAPGAGADELPAGDAVGLIGGTLSAGGDPAAIAGADSTPAADAGGSIGGTLAAGGDVAAVADGNAMPAGDAAGLVGGTLPAGGDVAGVAGGDAMPAGDVAGLIGGTVSAGGDVAAVAGGDAMPVGDVAGLIGGTVSAGGDVAAVTGGDAIFAVDAGGLIGGTLAAGGDVAAVAGAEAMPAGDAAGVAGAEAMPAGDAAGLIGGILLAGGDPAPVAGGDAMPAGDAAGLMGGTFSAGGDLAAAVRADALPTVDPAGQPGGGVSVGAGFAADDATGRVVEETGGVAGLAGLGAATPAGGMGPGGVGAGATGGGSAGVAAFDGSKPVGLAAPRGGKPDDLKRIRGIGRQNEARLHGLGIWHFDQIASWKPEEALWVGGYLAFPGRIEREDWIGQAKVLAGGGQTEFAKRVDTGELAYEPVTSDVATLSGGSFFTGTRPAALVAPRGGQADDLKLVNGIGRGIEKKLHLHGVWHFDQIAAMTEDELKWISEAVGFPGRALRENWAGECRILGAGGETDHSKAVKAGKIPSSLDDPGEAG
jgi:predicted flap endonuclease-1-like 5' DNA nuclease